MTFPTESFLWLPAFAQGFLMAVMMTGIPGPLNALGAQYTLTQGWRKGMLLAIPFCSGFMLVAFVLNAYGTSIVNHFWYTAIMSWLTTHQFVVSFASGIFLLGMAAYNFISTQDTMRPWRKLVYPALFVGTAFFPGNWLVASIPSLALARADAAPEGAALLMLVLGAGAFPLLLWAATVYVGQWMHGQAEQRALRAHADVERRLAIWGNRCSGVVFTLFGLLLLGMAAYTQL